MNPLRRMRLRKKYDDLQQSMGYILFMLVAIFQIILSIMKLSGELQCSWFYIFIPLMLWVPVAVGISFIITIFKYKDGLLDDPHI